MTKQKLTPIIQESFSQYSGAVLQSRALVDVRDCMKPSARQIFYCMETDKFTADKPFKKTLKAVGSAMRMYIHGDSSCEGVIMRSGQPFSMRYPLVEIEGSYGTVVETGNWAASRYTSARLSKCAGNLFVDIDKNTIDEWRDNYDDTEKYPTVLPSKGFYNICNGTFGIGIGLSASIPQFNIKDVNEALIKLLQNPNIADDEIICLPDFATGALLLNPNEVKESLKYGKGKACQLRAVINYDAKDHALVVSEIPYGVYTNTICGELEDILMNEEVINPGIDRFNDLTGEQPLIKIYLNKGANPTKVLSYLYKNTSLQYWFGINLTMLDNGKYPRTFTWKEALQAHINHEVNVYTRAFEFDLNKAKARLHIVNGLLIALANIEEVVEVIKKSSSTIAAQTALKQRFILDDLQTKAILDMKLSRLANLEVQKFENEKLTLEAEIRRITAILNSRELLNSEIITGWRQTISKFGDKRRTQIVAEGTYEEKAEVKIIPTLNLALNSGSILTIEPTDKFQINKKGTPWAKETALFAWSSTTSESVYFVDSAGKMYKYYNPEAAYNTVAEGVKAPLVSVIPKLNKEYFITVTKQGIVKKTLISEYTSCKTSTQAVKLRQDDTVVFAGVANDSDYLLLLSPNDLVNKIPVSAITSTGRATIGSKGIESGCISACVAAANELVVSISNSCGKYTECSDFPTGGKGGKGTQVAENTTAISTFVQDTSYLISGNKLIKLTPKTFSVKSKNSTGAKI